MRWPMHSTVWLASSDNRCSKSNIMGYDRRSSIPVAGIEIVRDVIPHRLLQGGKLPGVSGAAQLLDRRLREILVARLDRRRHFDVIDVRRAPQRFEHGDDHVAKAARAPGAHIVDSA